MTDGTIFQRGPAGEVPQGMSVNGVSGAEGTILAGGEVQSEHVTMFGPGWSRSWDNPGTGGDHSKNHLTGEITQH